MLWVLIIGLALALVALIVRHDAGTVAGMDSGDFASLAVKLALLGFLGGSVVMMFRERIGAALKSILIWLLIAASLAIAYTHRFELQTLGQRMLAELSPGYAARHSINAVEIVRGRGGDFQVAALINGVRVAMVLDTGASAVVLTQDAAKAAGLPIEVLQYDTAVETANGRTRTASVTLDRVGVGDIIERSVPALIAQPGQLRTSLLGMSFLNRLESWEVRGDKLVLRGPR